jgi:hypothetical protein
MRRVGPGGETPGPGVFSVRQRKPNSGGKAATTTHAHSA